MASLLSENAEVTSEKVSFSSSGLFVVHDQWWETHSSAPFEVPTLPLLLLLAVATSEGGSCAERVIGGSRGRKEEVEEEEEGSRKLPHGIVV